jgi:NifB/MoaA-like Fe-S oxidoreductase
MFKNDRAGEIMDQIRSLIHNGITLHCQIVVIPGVNDGDFLKNSITELGMLYPGIRSIGVIPVGRTRYAPDFPLVTPVIARELVHTIDTMQQYFRDLFQQGIVYAADELYCLSGLPIPPAAYYDEAPQIENGVGMARVFLDEITALRSRKRIGGRVLLVTSRAAAGFIAMLRERLITLRLINEENIHILRVDNDFFGPTVTVSGLLSACDINRALQMQDQKFDRIILPPNCQNDEREFIDSSSMHTETIVAPISVKELISWLQS